MKKKYGCDWFNVDDDGDMLSVTMMDNGDWEYTRLGIGTNKGMVFIVDLDDTGEEWREMLYCKKGVTIDEVLKSGVECNVFEEIEDGYGSSDKFRLKFDCDVDSLNRFNEMVGIKKVEGHGMLYSEMEMQDEN